MVKYLFSMVVFLGMLSTSLTAQITLERAVVGSSGQSVSSSSFYLESTSGQIEFNFATSITYQLNPGFQQGDPQLSLDTLSFVLNTFNTSCENVADGSAVITSIIGAIPPYTIEWSSGLGDSIVESLAPGNYEVKVIASNGVEAVKQFSIIGSTNSFCELDFYSGLSPNGDGINDLFLIDNVTLFPDNEMVVYNRYGEKVISIKNYNNTTRVWDGFNANGNALPEGTYFYIFEANSEFRKGWIEITN